MSGLRSGSVCIYSKLGWKRCITLTYALFLCKNMANEFLVRLNQNTYPHSQVIAHIRLNEFTYHKCSFSKCENKFEMLLGTTIRVRHIMLQWTEYNLHHQCTKDSFQSDSTD